MISDIRKWKLTTDSQGQTSILGPRLEKGEKLFVADLNALLELMEIIDRHMIRLGGTPPYGEAIKRLTQDIPPELTSGGFDVA